MKIVMTFYGGDKDLCLKNLDWLRELEGTIPYDCVLACDRDTDIRYVLERARQIFRKVDTCQYERAKWKGQLMLKWPWQQNNSFANVCRFMPQYKESWFWFETDCTPLKPGFLKTIEDEYNRGGKPFGGHWNKETGVFNGVAVYPSNVVMHCQKALMASLIVDDKTGYQPPWDAYMSKEVFPKLHVMNNVMQHLWCLPGTSTEVAPTFPDWATVEKWIRPEVVIFHRCKDGTLIDRMREHRNENCNFRGQDVVHPTITGVPATQPAKPAAKPKMVRQAI